MLSSSNILVMRNKVRTCNQEIFWVSKYFSESDLATLRLGMNDSIKKIRILSSKKRKDLSRRFWSRGRRGLGDTTTLERPEKRFDVHIRSQNETGSRERYEKIGFEKSEVARTTRTSPVTEL